MVEPQIVVLVVAGSSPVGHPALQSQNRKLQREFDLTDEKYYDRVFANGIEPAPRRSGYAGLSLAF